MAGELLVLLFSLFQTIYIRWRRGGLKRTRNAALYGIPMGKLATMANSLLAIALLKARLCEISWMARNRFWFAVAPKT